MRLELPSKRVAVNLLCSGALSPVSASEQGLHFWRPDKKKAAKAAWHITRPYTKASLGLVLFVRVVRVAVFFRRFMTYAFAVSRHQLVCQRV